MFHTRPFSSLMLASHRFLCVPLRLPRCTVPCRAVLASPGDLGTCPYHFSFFILFTEVRRSSYGPMAFSILVFTSLLVFARVRAYRLTINSRRLRATFLFVIKLVLILWLQSPVRYQPKAARKAALCHQSYSSRPSQRKHLPNTIEPLWWGLLSWFLNIPAPSGCIRLSESKRATAPKTQGTIVTPPPPPKKKKKKPKQTTTWKKKNNPHLG